MINKFSATAALLAVALAFNSCQNMDRPELGDYPEDSAKLPEGNLRFFVPFDKDNPELRYQFADEISGYPSFMPDKSITSAEGISGKAYKGNANAHLNYLSPNDFAAKAQSFTVAYWMKHVASTTNAEFVFSIPSQNGHWSKGTMMLMKESTEKGIAVKWIIVDKNNADTWLTWEGGDSVSPTGFFDDQWHHCAFIYDASASTLTFYKDGEKVGKEKKWGSHGAVNLDPSKVTGLKIGGPSGTDSWMKSWNGNLDQFRMYASPLTQAEVQDLYKSKK